MVTRAETSMTPTVTIQASKARRKWIRMVRIPGSLLFIDTVPAQNSSHVADANVGLPVPGPSPTGGVGGNRVGS